MQDKVLDEEFFSLNFPAMLWKVVDSDVFKSAKWDANGIYMLIEENRFQKVLRRKGTPIFQSDSFAIFAHQLDLYGFQRLSAASSKSKVNQ